MELLNGVEIKKTEVAKKKLNISNFNIFFKFAKENIKNIIFIIHHMILLKLNDIKASGNVII